MTGDVWRGLRDVRDDEAPHPEPRSDLLSSASGRATVQTPNDFSSLADVEDRLLGFECYYESIATPFDWRFTKHDLTALVRKVDRDTSALSVAA